MADIVEAAFEADIADAHPAVAEQAYGGGDPLFIQKLHKGLVRHHLEQHSKIGFGESGQIGHLLKRDVVHVVLVHIFNGLAHGAEMVFQILSRALLRAVQDGALQQHQQLQRQVRLAAKRRFDL